jgi:hypothetical protein
MFRISNATGVKLGNNQRMQLSKSATGKVTMVWYGRSMYKQTNFSTVKSIEIVCLFVNRKLKISSSFKADTQFFTASTAHTPVNPSQVHRALPLL